MTLAVQEVFAPYSDYKFWYYRGTYCLHPPSTWTSSFALKMKIVCYSRTSEHLIPT